jgi:hypothetical protein
MVRDAVEIRDTRTGIALLAPTHHKLLDGFDAGIRAQTTFRNQTHGVDVIVTLTNDATTPQRLGRLQLGIFNLGEQIDYLWSRMNAEMKPASARQHVGQAWMYPTDLYSPVMVMRNTQQAVGVSINYPVLEYKHDVRVAIASPGNWAEQGEAGRGWFLSLEFRNFGNESVYTRMNHEGSMRPGETRTYVVSIRTTDQPGEWIRTLLPYRDYFRGQYGAVRYARETTPVFAYTIADSSLQSSSNPRGFGTAFRPDLRGFGPFVRHVASRNWNEVMVWAPTGMYYQNRALNWPFHFASEFVSTPGLDTADSTTDGFPWLVNQGMRVGLWWGRSSSYISSWDASTMVPLNPNDPVHRAAAFAELDAAVGAGATVIGLDTFTPEFVPMHDLLAWLEAMQARHPGVRFVTEPSQCDILHTHAATWYDGWRDIQGTTSDRDQLFPIQGPNVLSDFLNPGSESWVGLGYRPPYTRSFGRPTDAQVIADTREVAEWGFRPIVSWDMVNPPAVQSAASWEFTLPPDIRDSDPFIANLRAGRLPGVGAAPTPSDTEGDGGSVSGTGASGGSGSSGSGTEGQGGNTGTGEQPGSSPSGGNTGNSGSGMSSGSGASFGSGSGAGSGGTTPPVIVVLPPTPPQGNPQPGPTPPQQTQNEQYASSAPANQPSTTSGAGSAGASPQVQVGDELPQQTGGSGGTFGQFAQQASGNASTSSPGRTAFFGGTSRRGVDAGSRRSGPTAFRVVPRQPAPLNGPLAAGGSSSVSPPNLNPAPIATSAPVSGAGSSAGSSTGSAAGQGPRVSSPTLSATQATSALRRANGSDRAGSPATVVRSGTSRRVVPVRPAIAPVTQSGPSSTGTSSTGSSSTSNNSSSGTAGSSESGTTSSQQSQTGSSGSGTQTVTNPSAQPRQN